MLIFAGVFIFVSEWLPPHNEFRTLKAVVQGAAGVDRRRPPRCKSSTKNKTCQMEIGVVASWSSSLKQQQKCEFWFDFVSVTTLCRWCLLSIEPLRRDTFQWKTSRWFIWTLILICSSLSICVLTRSSTKKSYWGIFVCFVRHWSVS